MNDSHVSEPHLEKKGPTRRKGVSVSQNTMITSEMLQPGTSLPLLIQPAIKGLDLRAWVHDNQEYVKAQLLQYGAVLFRGFHIAGLEEFEAVAKAVSGELLEYRFRASPRSQVRGNIYTSTDYPPEYSIFPHNEHSYSPVFPAKIFFFCVTSAKEGGETPIGSNRDILRYIDPEVRDRFIEKKILYVRNYGDGFGLPWQTVFQSEDRAVVEEYCRANGITAEWKSDDRLMTSQVGPAVIKHPQSGEMVWFNHATFFHVSTLEPTVRDGLLASFKEEDLPNNTYYGDGSPIEPDVLEHLREAYARSMMAFPWQEGDLMMLDNILAVHARAPFVGPRKIVVAMAEPINNKQV